MRFALLGILFTFVTFAAETASTQPSTQPVALKVGAAAVVITPELGTPLAGYFYTRLADGVHDDLYAKATVIEEGGAKAALVVCDLVTMPRAVVEKARELIEQQTGIPGDHVMISATHTHTGPIMMLGSIRDPSEGGEHDLSQKFTNELPAKIAQAVKEANDKLVDANAYTGLAEVTDVSHNRRVVMRDGHVGWNVGKLNPNFLHPAGPIDPQLQTVFFQTIDADPKPIAAYVNFACHPDVVAGTKISADFPGAVCTVMTKVLGPGTVTTFANGACGDLNHIDPNTSTPQQGYKEAYRIGTELAGAALQAIARQTPVTARGLHAMNKIVELPLPTYTQEELIKARHDAVTFGKKVDFLSRVKAFKILDVAAREGKPQQVEVQVIALGNEVAWVGLPGEMFTELGMQIKESSPYRRTIIVELANGAIGYIPTRRAYGEGNYEPTNARCAAGSGEILVEEACKMLREVRRDHHEGATNTK